MNVFEAIDTRISVPALTDPGPTDAQWEILLRAGARAPDHGRIMAGCGLGDFSSCAAPRASCSAT